MRNWKPIEKDILRRFWLELDMDTLCKKLGRNKLCINNQAKALGLPPKPPEPRKNATDPEVLAYISKYAGKKSVKEMSKVLKRPTSTIYGIGNKLGKSMKVKKGART